MYFWHCQFIQAYVFRNCFFWSFTLDSTSDYFFFSFLKMAVFLVEEKRLWRQLWCNFRIVKNVKLWSLRFVVWLELFCWRTEFFFCKQLEWTKNFLGHIMFFLSWGDFCKISEMEFFFLNFKWWDVGWWVTVSFIRNLN